MKLLDGNGILIIESSIFMMSIADISWKDFIPLFLN